MVLGTTTGRPDPVRIGLESLRRHMVVFAGSGSGKTVLIRRLIEECALRGVSAIVLDPNNDLARLGEAWPSPPAGWGPGDEDRAAAYLSGTDVVVWTPGWQGGRPLTFQPLPRFADVLDDPDGFAAAVNAAVATLAPHARVDGGTDKARLGRAVLREALISYARTGANDLREFAEVLNDLPDGVSQLDSAQKLAASMAQLLKAAQINDPLFGGAGTPVDPGELLTPGPGRRAGVSVISFVGLPDDQQRQSFVNQLQLALFTWIKRHPVGDRPLGGLFVMDEAQTLAPSGALTACTQSTLALTSQARKYGLGLVFATQAPKALHNQIPGNAATQFVGLLTAPVQIEAARDVARAKGTDVPDVGKLRTGQFYTGVEGARFVKMQAPMCLSHHPRSPLTTEEVVRRAATSAPGS
ncbi:ATP-binding protein [Micromonosporaceae bacterium B7E4]